jgi:tripartite-type tricarboxylate transporter receptor subunit TctC
VVVPAGTPQSVIARLNSEFNAMLQTADMRDRLTTLGSEIIGGSPKQLGDYVRKEIPIWAKVIKESGATAD